MSVDVLVGHAFRSLGDTEVARTCALLIEKISHLSQKEGRFLTYRSLQKLAEHKSLEPSLVAAVQFLVSSEYPLLEPHGQLIDESGHEHTIDKAELFDVISGGELVHPVTGNLIENPLDAILPFFTVVSSVSSGISQK